MVVIRTSTRRKIVDQRIIFTFRFTGEGFGTVENCMVIRNSHLGLNYLDVSRFKNYYYSLQDFLYDMEFDSTTEQLVRVKSPHIACAYGDLFFIQPGMKMSETTTMT